MLVFILKALIILLMMFIIKLMYHYIFREFDVTIDVDTTNQGKTKHITYIQK